MKRFYSFCCVFYGNHNELIEFLCKVAHHYFYILHDRDEPDPHYHIYFTSKMQRSYSSVRRLMISSSNLFVQHSVDTPYSYMHYLLHEGDEVKFNYTIDDIRYDDKEYFQRIFKDDLDLSSIEHSFIDDLLSDDYDLRSMGMKYGRDFIKNWRSYDDFRSEVLWNDRRKRQ